MPNIPMGANISGMAAGSPRIVVERSLRHIDQYALAELDPRQIVAISAQCVLGIGTAIRIVEKRFWHAALVELAQVFDAGNVFHRRFPALLVFIALSVHLARLKAPQNRAAEQAAHHRRACHDSTTLRPRRR